MLGVCIRVMLVIEKRDLVNRRVSAAQGQDRGE